MEKDKKCYLLHCQNLSNCNLLKKVVEEMMSASKIDPPGHVYTHLGELEFIGLSLCIQIMTTLSIHSSSIHVR